MVSSSSSRATLMARCCLLATLPLQVVSDTYLNNPRGSNNKMTEQNNGRQNDRRLFDSQNNANGGYQVYDKCVPNCLDGNNYDHSKDGSQEGHMYYYHGSELLVEWTMQHACGNPVKNTMCQAVIQYMCSSDVDTDSTLPGLRDGKDDNANRRRSAGGSENGNTNADNANEDDAADAVRPRHEPYADYDACRKRQRNKGLYTADQAMRNDRGATSTRQNRNGNRYGLECPEERDYYPYWHPSGWRDVVVFTSQPEHCSFYREESQNVKGKHYCKVNLGADPDALLDEDDQIPNNQKACEAYPGTWIEQEPWDIDPPECLGLPEIRDNHHGNAKTGKMVSYLWEIPDDIPDGDRCVMRLRYNMTSLDFNNVEEGSWDPFFDLTSAHNANPPLKGDPTGDWLNLGMGVASPLQLQVNTAQFGRTFQDRTHTFLVKKRPDEVDNLKRIVNYNVRGRRGNIVQVYPVVEYDFVPQDLEVNAGDLVHFQWGGSDANAQGNAGNGRQGTDRSNIVQIPARGKTKPVSIWEHTLFHDFERDFDSDEAEAAKEIVKKFAFLNQQAYAEQAGTSCPATLDEADDVDANDDNNCNQLNAAPAYFDGGLVELKNTGTFYVASTRNNDYSNRSHKAMITVNMRNYRWWEVLIVVGSCVLFVALMGLITSAAYAYMNPTSSAFAKRNRPILLRLPCMRSCIRSKEAEREKYKAALREAWKLRNEKFQQQQKAVGVAKAGPGGMKKALDPNNAEMTKPPKIKNEEIVSNPNMEGKITVPRRRCAMLGTLRKLYLWTLTGDTTGDSDATVVLMFYFLQVFCGAMGCYNNWNNGVNKWFPVAKTGGYILDLNLSLLLIPTMRSVQRWLQQVRPLDTIFNGDPIGFHIKVATWTAIGALIHIVGHVAHFISVITGPRFQVAINAKQEMSGMYWYEYVFNPKNRFAFVTGVAITMMMSAMAITASVRVRRHTFDFSKGKIPRTCRDCISNTMLVSALVLVSPFWLIKKSFQLMVSCCMFRDMTKPLQQAKGGNKKVGGFLIFWAVHKCWMPCYFLLLFHGPQCWIWFLIPLVFLACDRLIMAENRDKQIVLKSAELARSKVIKLQFGIPPGFVYQAGMYVHLCCDQINPEEWHPFTLTSCPEENCLSVAIRAPDDLDWCSALRRKLVEEPVERMSEGAVKAGPGTKIIYKPYIATRLEVLEAEEAGAEPQLFEGSQMFYARPTEASVADKDGKPSQNLKSKDADKKKDANSNLRKVALGEAPGPDDESTNLTHSDTIQSLEDFLRPVIPADCIRLRVDGPHGAPSELVWKHKVVMLVGAGIGVTPFASILKSLQFQLKAQNSLRSRSKGDPAAPATNTNNHSAARDLLNWEACQHVHFYWLCRNQEEFFWFHDMLVDAVQGPGKDRIEVNLFQTAETEIKEVKRIHESFKQFMGRPNWKRIFPKLAEQYPGETIGTFLCGPQALRGELQRAAFAVHSSDQNGSKFNVHAENF